MHGILSKALVLALLWSGTGMALTAWQTAENFDWRANTDCASAGPSSTACPSYLDNVAAALAAG